MFGQKVEVTSKNIKITDITLHIMGHVSFTFSLPPSYNITRTAEITPNGGLIVSDDDLVYKEKLIEAVKIAIQKLDDIRELM